MTDAVDRPFDPGLQTERTLLAWRRTTLALAVGNAVAIRYLAEVLGGAAVVLGVAGLALAGVAWVVADRRYRRAHRGLVRERRLVTDGTLPALLAASVLAAGASGVLLLVTTWRPW